MEIISFIIDFIIHIDVHLKDIFEALGPWTYVILFLIIFCETGLVVTPFLPGDSFLFATGVMAAVGNLELVILIPLLLSAAIIGDTTNYFIGRTLGDRVYEKGKMLFINKKHLEKARDFYMKNGLKAIIMARFVPIIRTFAPFVAGVSTMPYGTFIRYSIIGSLIWVPLFTLAGFFFGEIDFIAENIGLIGIGIIVVSVLPIIIGFLRSRKKTTV